MGLISDPAARYFYAKKASATFFIINTVSVLVLMSEMAMITWLAKMQLCHADDNRFNVCCVFFFPSHSVCVLNLQSDGETVTDSNPHLASCCELLELVLRKGLQRQYHYFV